MLNKNLQIYDGTALIFNTTLTFSNNIFKYMNTSSTAQRYQKKRPQIDIYTRRIIVGEIHKLTYSDIGIQSFIFDCGLLNTQHYSKISTKNIYECILQEQNPIITRRILCSNNQTLTIAPDKTLKHINKECVFNSIYENNKNVYTFQSKPDQLKML